MTINDILALPCIRWLVPIYDWLDDSWGYWRMRLFTSGEVTRIAVVGDLSMQDPSRLDLVLTKALANADLVVQIGDMHSGYDVIKKHLKSGRLLVIPGNHDDRYDSLGEPRRWFHALPHCTLVGLDNSHDRFSQEDWDILAEVTAECQRPLLVFAHKPLSNVVLPDGSENRHVMGESGDPQAKSDAVRLQKWLAQQPDCLFVCGHWHGWNYSINPLFSCLIEGRGGAAPVLGYSLLVLTPEGLSLHRIDLCEPKGIL